MIRPLILSGAPVATIGALSLKKVETETAIKYGLFTAHDKIVDYLELEKYNADKWQVILVQIANAYKSQGYGTFCMTMRS